MSIYTISQIKISKQENLNLINQRVHLQKGLIDYWLVERGDDIRKLSHLEEFRRLDKQQMKRILDIMQQDNKSFDSLSYIDDDGLFRLSTLSSGIKYPSAIGKPYFEAAIMGKEYISDVVIGRNSGVPIINFSSPIYDFEGNFQGLILGSVKITTLEILLSDNWFGKTGELLVVNRGGTLLTQSHYAKEFIFKGLIKDSGIMGFKLSDDALRNIRLGDSGTAVWIDHLGNKVLGAYLDVPERGWTLIGKIDEEEVLGPIYKQLSIMTGATICLIFLMIPLATLITNRIKRPLDWLINQSKLITIEHYEMIGHDKYVGNTSYELDALCETFVNMRHKIENTINLLRENEIKLEHKVQQRTIALSEMNRALEKRIGKHKAANKALQDGRDALAVSENRYKDLFDYMHNGCVYYKVLFDEAGKPIDLEHVHANHTYEKYAGHPVSELIGKPLTEIFPYINEESFNWMKVITTVAISREPISFTQYHEYQERWYSVSAYSPAQNRVALIIEDVTNYVTLQKEIARMDRLNLIGSMAAGLAHEIRNPMTVVKGYLQYFKKKIPNHLHDQFDLVLSELARIEMIITDFLSIAKNAPTKLEKQDLNAIIHSIAPLLQTDALKRGMTLELKLSTDIPELILSGKEIKQLVLNIAINGLNAMNEHGTLTIETKVQDSAVLLYIDDCGSGIPKDLQSKIFDPFFTTRDTGTGLGLSVCASIVASHNGTIEVESKEGKGTRFIISFPI